VATAGTALGLLLAGTAAVVLRMDEAPPERRWGAVSFPLAWATPALLALLARRRPVLLVPAALLATVLAFSSLSGAALLLLVPAGLWVAAAGGGRPRWPGPARTAVVLALPLGGLAAFAALLVHEDPVCWDVVRSADGDETDRVRSEPACGDDFGVGAASGTGSFPPVADDSAVPGPDPYRPTSAHRASDDEHTRALPTVRDEQR